jgi:hypothetical protein
MAGEREQVDITIEAESPGDSRTLFRVRLGRELVGVQLTAAEVHLLVGQFLERIALPKYADHPPK